MYSIVATILAESSQIQVVESVTELMARRKIDFLPSFSNLVLFGFEEDVQSYPVESTAG